MADVDWRAFMARHGGAALLYARQITGTLPDAEDALHDGFVRFWRRRAGAHDQAGLFFACVRTAALDLQRANRRRGRRDQSLAAAWFDLPDDTASCSEEVEKALRGLNAAQREVVVLKIWGGLTFAEVAEVLGELPNTVAGRYRDALGKMTAALLPEVNHERR